MRRFRIVQELETRQAKWSGNFNVEPTLILISLAVGIQMNCGALFTYWARCIELADKYHGESKENATYLCSTLSAPNNSDFNDIVEKDIASTRIYIQIAGTIPTLIVAPIIGNWSDHHGRRRPLLLALAGMVVYEMLQLLATLNYESISIYEFSFAAEIIGGLTGGVGTLYAAILSIITDDSRGTLRPGNSEIPMRIAVASGIQAAGGMFGALLMSWLSVPAMESVSAHVGGYIKAAAITSVLMVLAFLYSVFFVRETHRPSKDLFIYENEEQDQAESNYLMENSVESLPSHQPGRLSRLISKIRIMFEVLVERRPGYTRLCLNLSLIFIFVEFLALDAQLLFLFLKRQPFAWSDRMFSLLSFLRGVFFTFGMIVLPVMMKKINMLGKDSFLIGLGVTFGAISFFVVSFATTNEEIIGSSLLSIFSGAIAPGYRTFMPRMVPKEQTARLLTVVSVIISLCPIISSLVFNNLYSWSLLFWPGFAFFVGGVFQTVVAIGQLVIHLLMRPQWLLDSQMQGRRLLEDDDEDGEEGEDEHTQHPPIRPQYEEPKTIEDDERSVSTVAVGSSLPDSREDLLASSTIEERRPIIL